jgi:membrane protein DedA with SNARE-associated domain
METLFIQHLYFLDWGVYLIIFIGMILEGEAVLFTAFYLAHQGHLRPEIVVFVALAGIFIGDILWYKLGAHLEKSSIIARKIAAKASKQLDRRLVRRPLITIFISKFTYGIYHAVLLRTGALKIRFKTFLQAVISSSIIWFSLIGGLAYFSSVSMILLKRYFKYGEIGLVAGIIIFFTITHFISRISKKEIEDWHEENNKH